ncbi:MAG TPA: hypothetical protein VJQ84_01145, partial [Solirubrobacterales bacterium]|nr:hypothetical protein [Solirubrobacterales bacterium]
AAAAASRGAEACHTAGFAPLEVMNKALAGRCRRLAGELGQALAVHRGAHEIARSLDGVAMQIVTEELAADHAAAGDWEAAREWAAASIAARNEMWMFAYLCLPELAEIHLHHGLPFTIPPLPEGDRYRLIELRTRLVMEPSEELRVEALELAKRLELPLETSRLET